MMPVARDGSDPANVQPLPSVGKISPLVYSLYNMIDVFVIIFNFGQ
jgi:hypothetical protein